MCPAPRRAAEQTERGRGLQRCDSGGRGQELPPPPQTRCHPPRNSPRELRHGRPPAAAAASATLRAASGGNRSLRDGSSRPVPSAVRSCRPRRRLTFCPELLSCLGLPFGPGLPRAAGGAGAALNLHRPPAPGSGTGCFARSALHFPAMEGVHPPAPLWTCFLRKTKQTNPSRTNRFSFLLSILNEWHLGKELLFGGHFVQLFF